MDQWDEFPDEVFEQMPPNLVAQNPMLRRLDAAHLAGLETREHITAILRDPPTTRVFNRQGKSESKSASCDWF